MKKKDTLGKKSKKRAVWDISPVTQVKKDKSKYPNRQEVKKQLKDKY